MYLYAIFLFLFVQDTLQTLHLKQNNIVQTDITDISMQSFRENISLISTIKRTPLLQKVLMRICAIIFQLWLGGVDVSQENQTISRRFLTFLLKPLILLLHRKNSIDPFILALRCLFLSLTSFNSLFGHHHRNFFIYLICSL